METYLILRRSGWETPAAFEQAADRSRAVCDQQLSEDVRWLRSYLLDEQWARIGSICVYEAPSPEAIRRHARLADLPVDEIVLVAGTVIERADPERVSA
jgi:Nickel responsive protein SCO4226-like